jgi:hypothetical protein
MGSHTIRQAYFIGSGDYPEGLAGYVKSPPVAKPARMLHKLRCGLLCASYR